VSGATAYDVQASTSSSFTTVIDSGWLSGTSYNFSGLTVGSTYYYRVRARTSIGGPDSNWSQALTQFAPDTLTNVTDGTGGVSLSGTSSPVTGIITNPSFETGDLTGWTKTSQGNQFVEVSVGDPPMPTNGNDFALFYSSYGSAVNAGDDCSIAQTVNLTGISSIQFDAVLGLDNEWNNEIKLDFLVDGASVWTQTTAGSYLNQSISTAGLTGTHTIAFRSTALGSFSQTYTHLGVDNLRAYSSVYNSTGSVVSNTIAPSPFVAWGILSYGDNVTASGTALTVDVLNATGALLASNVSSGTDLNSIPAVTNATGIQLRANLSTSNSANTPALTNWSVSYYTQGVTAWSTAVTSTQVAAPSIGNGPPPSTASAGASYSFAYQAGGYPVPTFSVTSGSLPTGLALSSSGVISGTPTQAGVYTGTVTAGNGIGTAATQDFTISVFSTFTSWATQGFTAQQMGDSTISGPAAMPQKDGVPNLLKYLYNINPSGPMSATDLAALPTLAITTTDSTEYLTLTYRQYQWLDSSVVVTPQTSVDLQSWSPAPGATQIGNDPTTHDPIMQVQVPFTGNWQFIRLNVIQQ